MLHCNNTAVLCHAALYRISVHGAAQKLQIIINIPKSSLVSNIDCIIRW